MPAADSAGFGSNNPFRRKTSFKGDPSPAFSTPSSGSAAAPSSSFLAAATAAASSPSSSAPRPPPPLTTFKSAAADDVDAADYSARAGRDSVQLKPKKIVKKVRVQSPPPSSPEDVVPVRSYSAHDNSDDDDDTNSDVSHDETRIDPFSSEATELNRPVVPDEPAVVRPPANPFSKTLQDLEQPALGQDNSAVAAGKGSLDVDSFKRLLLTGQANASGPAGQGQSVAGSASQPATTREGTSFMDASSSRQSQYDTMQESPKTSHETYEPRVATVPSASPPATAQPSSGRKPPPPPSSRHGKLIKMEFGADSKAKKPANPNISINTNTANAAPNRKSSTHSLTQPSSAGSDVNKPLPAPPLRPSGEEEVVSPFDAEAAGKVPESMATITTSPRPPTPPAGLSRDRSTSQSSTLTASSSHKKPAAPPPRRQGHGRTESKPPSIRSERAEEDAPRSSIESTRSRADSIRVNINYDKNASAPAPPPPRRPNHARQSSTLASPSVSSFSQSHSPGSSDESRSPGVLGFNPMENQTSYMPTVTHNKDGLPKLSPPPPPPARHASLRRPSSAHSTDASSIRKVSREKEGIVAPPPPPPRARGASRASLNAAESQSSFGRRRTGSEVDKVDEEPATIQNTEVSQDSEIPAASSGGGDDIMEQIRALQLEVEAARKASG
ncbi:hypothetical protein BJ166DRAFT_532032 [Pestalotiopsis sp. NC0098]|nr:hypothetical protein BJ166DRAFT_532032 [Pestalotiopsis sp. NC0098]